MSSGMNLFFLLIDDNSIFGGECVNKFQRQDGFLQVLEVVSLVVMINQVCQVGYVIV